MEALFSALKDTNKQLIVRFLYDWEGKAKESEPDDLELILRHMEQVSGVLNAYKDCIYLTQGLFIGNCGEINNSNYNGMEDLRRLAEHYLSVTDPSIFLSVRTPAQWRQATGLKESVSDFNSTAARIGLYNDGLMGSAGDLGTYGDADRGKPQPFTWWGREEELEFQNQLCRIVPNGGEAVVENPLNDFENAVSYLARLHVSYLNRGYDQNVLNKWAQTTVEEGIFAGFDGLTYIERHLGYRFLIQQAQVDYDSGTDTISAEVALQNVGFAPIYRKANVYLVICDQSGQPVFREAFSQDLRKLHGGEDTGETLTFRMKVPVFGWQTGTYEVYFAVEDPVSGQILELANEQERMQYGYKIATIGGVIP